MSQQQCSEQQHQRLQRVCESCSCSPHALSSHNPHAILSRSSSSSSSKPWSPSASSLLSLTKLSPSLSRKREAAAEAEAGEGAWCEGRASASCSRALPLPEPSLRTTLLRVCRSGNVASLREVVWTHAERFGKALSLNVNLGSGWTPLAVAAACGHLSLVRALLAEASDPSILVNGTTALHVALLKFQFSGRACFLDIANLLHGADEDAHTRNDTLSSHPINVALQDLRSSSSFLASTCAHPACTNPAAVPYRFCGGRDRCCTVSAVLDAGLLAVPGGAHDTSVAWEDDADEGFQDGFRVAVSMACPPIPPRSVRPPPAAPALAFPMCDSPVFSSPPSPPAFSPHVWASALFAPDSAPASDQHTDVHAFADSLFGGAFDFFAAHPSPSPSPSSTRAAAPREGGAVGVIGERSSSAPASSPFFPSSAWPGDAFQCAPSPSSFPAASEHSHHGFALTQLYAPHSQPEGVGSVLLGGFGSMLVEELGG